MKEFKIPDYVKYFLERSAKEVHFRGRLKEYATEIGYCLIVEKGSYYTYASTFTKECERVVKWANRIIPESAFIISTPTVTRHRAQFAWLVIYDPIMQWIEKYINTREQWDKMRF